MGAHITAKTLAQVEKDHILQTVQLCHGNKAKAAKFLGVRASLIYRRLKEWGLPPSYGRP